MPRAERCCTRTPRAGTPPCSGAQRRSCRRISGLARGLPLRIPAAMLLVTAVLLVTAGAVLGLAACDDGEPASPPPEPPVGRRFPSVVGDALSGDRVRLPEDFAGAPVIVVVAPSGEAQEDADRFLVSLRTRRVAFAQIPVLPSLVTRLTQRYHNGKLKETEPRDMWGRIVPLYKDGAVLAEFLGELEDERLAIVFVLDGDGVIRFQDGGGHDAAALDAAVAVYERLRP